MDYRYIQAFFKTAQRLSFTKAAEDLGITQAAISRQIKLLEASLNMQLFIRSPRSVCLTPQGEKLFQKTQRFNQWVNEDFMKGTPTIKMAVLQGILESWLLEFVGVYFSNSNINFTIETGDKESINQKVESGEVDIAINLQNIQNEQLTSFKLIQEKIVIVSKKEIDPDPKTLSQYPWVTFDPDSYFIPYCKNKSSRIIEVKSTSSVLKLVSKGIGIAMLPSHFIINPSDFYIYPTKGFKNEVVWVTLLNYSTPPEYLNSFIKKLRLESNKLSKHLN